MVAAPYRILLRETTFSTLFNLKSNEHHESFSKINVQFDVSKESEELKQAFMIVFVIMVFK